MVLGNINIIEWSYKKVLKRIFRNIIILYCLTKTLFVYLLKTKYIIFPPPEQINSSRYAGGLCNRDGNVLVFKSRALVHRTITVLLGVMSSALNHNIIVHIPTLIGNRGTSRHRTLGVCIPLIHRATEAIVITL